MNIWISDYCIMHFQQCFQAIFWPIWKQCTQVTSESHNNHFWNAPIFYPYTLPSTALKVSWMSPCHYREGWVQWSKLEKIAKTSFLTFLAIFMDFKPRTTNTTIIDAPTTHHERTSRSLNAHIRRGDVCIRSIKKEVLHNTTHMISHISTSKDNMQRKRQIIGILRG